MAKCGSKGHKTIIAETGPFLDDGLTLMIEKGWFEQPQMASDRKKLSV